ncbi:MAG: helix-turn-helix transcriptional regulator [Lachnospiraceae bacterium]|nr:helix-turn-helix transcriptional regulator [Lachnospiraceae bacterium]
MPRQYKQARKLNHLKAIQAAKMLGVSQPTLSAWEGERKSPSIDSLENMANLYGVTTDYLLGRENFSPDSLVPVSVNALPALDGKPVWSAAYGWALVMAAERLLLLSDRQTIAFADAGELFLQPPPFSESASPCQQPLSQNELVPDRKIWLEPISSDRDLRMELRGWYRIKGRWAENEHGNRFALDTYGAKWLAFMKENE